MSSFSFVQFGSQRFSRMSKKYVYLCSGRGKGKRQRTPPPAFGQPQQVAVANLFAPRTSAPTPPSATVPWAAPSPNLRAPVIYNKVRGSLPTAPITEQEKVQVMDELEADITVEGTRRVRESYWRTWNTFHARWFGHSVPVLPQNSSSISAVAAQSPHERFAWWRYAFNMSRGLKAHTCILDLQMFAALTKPTKLGSVYAYIFLYTYEST